MTNTSDTIADALRAAILRGEFQSHEPLRQDKIAADFGVSKVPIREAFAQLKSEGLIDIHANRGASIAGLSAQEAEEIYTVRIALETILLQRAIPVLSKQDLVRAENVLRLLDVAESPASWGEMNWEFHTLLYTAANMQKTLRLLEPLHVNVARYVVLYLDQLGHQEQSQAEHYRILEACRQGDTETAVNILQQHLQSASQQLVQFLKAKEAK